MKKLFISCPMKGRTEENIRNSMERLHKIAEAYFDQELETIDSYIKNTPPENSKQSVWYLGESVKKMAEADYYIGVVNTAAFNGCYIENSVARAYNIPYFLVDIGMMPDAKEIDDAYWKERRDEASHNIW